MKHESHDWKSLDWDEAPGEMMCSRCAVCTCCSNPDERSSQCTEVET